MAGSRVPRVVLATRATELELLIERHGTLGQARFFLESRGQSLAAVRAQKAEHDAAVAAVDRAIPADWRRSRVVRPDFDRFLFEPDDIVVAVGQDGLVPNLAKYLRGQLVIGINPSPDLYDGVLVTHRAEGCADLLLRAAHGDCQVDERAMVEARLDDGQHLLALNELFVGHRTHQSARYRLEYRGEVERQSSSGLIVATGTGATGWARSIHRQRACSLELPGTAAETLVFFVREAFPSQATGTSVTEGLLAPGEALSIVSEMDLCGVVFGDGIETDTLRPLFGQRIEVRTAATRLRLMG